MSDSKQNNNEKKNNEDKKELEQRAAELRARRRAMFDGIYARLSARRWF